MPEPKEAGQAWPCQAKCQTFTFISFTFALCGGQHNAALSLPPGSIQRNWELVKALQLADVQDVYKCFFLRYTSLRLFRRPAPSAVLAGSSSRCCGTSGSQCRMIARSRFAIARSLFHKSSGSRFYCARNSVLRNELQFSVLSMV